MKLKVISILFVLTYTVVNGHGGYAEKITLSTDREIYIAGETLWYFASVYENSNNSDSLLSKILYLELYDQKFNSIVRQKSRINDGFAAGFITIPAGISTGNYLLRAYTQYSRNLSPYLQKTVLLSIVNPQIPLSENETSLKDDIYVVPEGGSMIAGISSRVAVRMHPDYYNVNSDISVVDDSGEVVTSASLFENGLSLFGFTPEARRNYTVIIKETGGTAIRKPLMIRETGVMLKCSLNSLNLKIELMSSGDNLAGTGFGIKVISSGMNKIYEGSINAGSALDISMKGIDDDMVFCLCEQNNEIVDIRPVFIGSSYNTKIEVRTDKQFYLPRDEIKPDFELPAAFQGRALVSAVCSETVCDAQNIIPWYVAYNPVFFERAIDRVSYMGDSLRSQIDALMILYSDLYRKIGFADYLKGEPSFDFLPDLRDAGISGTAVDSESHEPVKNVMVYCSVIDESSQVHIYKTGADGRFFFTLNHLSGDLHNIYICPVNVENVELLINSDFEMRYPESAGLIPFIPDSSYAGLLRRMYRNSQVNSIFPEYREIVRENKLFHPLIKPDPVHIVNLTEYIEMPVMQEVFSEIVPFVTVKQKGSNFYMQIFDERIKTSFDEPLVMLDGIPVFDMNQIMTISPELVEQITVTNRILYLGEYALNGMIGITTTTENFAGIKLPSASKFIEFLGVNEESYPVFPKHLSGETDRIPDFRTLLYWNPGITNESISFSVGDDTGVYKLSVLATDGKNTYRGITTFEVQK